MKNEIINLGQLNKALKNNVHRNCTFKFLTGILLVVHVLI